MIITGDGTVGELDGGGRVEGAPKMRVIPPLTHPAKFMIGLLTVLVWAPTGGTAVAAPPPSDPPLQVQNQTDNHSMGITIETFEGGQPGAAPPTGAVASVLGIDVSSYQGDVNWPGQWNAGKRFAYVKATEGTTYTNPFFTQQYNGSYGVGMIRGAYHFARPDQSSGASQARYFVEHGGGWSSDGKTLPGALDMEYNPYGATCFGKSPSGMVSWVRDFHDTYFTLTGRYPVIYTSTSWWNLCAGSGHGFGATVPLWVARYASSVGTLPSGWSYYTFWQYTATPIDQNRFNGAYDRLVALATG